MTPPREWAAMETLPEKWRQCWRKSDTMRFISAATSSRITWDDFGKMGERACMDVCTHILRERTYLVVGGGHEVEHVEEGVVDEGAEVRDARKRNVPQPQVARLPHLPWCGLKG